MIPFCHHRLSLSISSSFWSFDCLQIIPSCAGLFQVFAMNSASAYVVVSTLWSDQRWAFNINAKFRVWLAVIINHATINNQRAVAALAAWG
jgi:hypothetical protein